MATSKKKASDEEAANERASNVVGNVGNVGNIGNIGNVIGTITACPPLEVKGRISSGVNGQCTGSLTLYPPDGWAWFHLDNGPAGGRPLGRLRISHGPKPGDNEIMSITQTEAVGIGTPAPACKFHVVGNRIRLENGGKVLDLRADGAAVDLQTETSDLYIRSTGPGNHIFLNPYGNDGNVGIKTTNPQATLHVNGNIMASGDIVLQNADCAEDFDVPAQAQVDPGTVMVLTEEGGLVESRAAYDTKVAGVISGAGDLKPGLVLDRQPGQAGRLPIALMGKVYAKVDADQAPVAVGDLLTTSPTPGHAMKATDPLRSFGAIIGKALRPLAAGRGMIPILVALQ